MTGITRGTPVTGSRRVVWWLAFVLVGAGLVAMHGLGSHGTNGHQTGHAAHLAAPVTSTTPVAGPAPDAGADPMGLMGLCLAVLAGGVLVLLALRPGRPTHAVVASRVHTVPARSQRRRAPPDLNRLCVRRC